MKIKVKVEKWLNNGGGSPRKGLLLWKPYKLNKNYRKNVKIITIRDKRRLTLLVSAKSVGPTL